MAGNPELRQRLERITEEYTEWVVGLQILAIAALREEWPHAISLIQEAVIGEPRTYDFNCHAFAFQLHELDAFWEIRLSKPDLRPTGRFVLDRLVPSMESVDLREARRGDVGLHFDEGGVTHSGVLADRDIESKWGTAHRWQHRLFEVPSSYGSHARYFRRPASKSVVDAYLEFATTA
jgi:hypothetical protein